MLRGGLGGVRGYEGVLRVNFVTEMAQVELAVDECKPLVVGTCPWLSRESS